MGELSPRKIGSSNQTVSIVCLVNKVKRPKPPHTSAFIPEWLWQTQLEDQDHVSEARAASCAQQGRIPHSKAHAYGQHTDVCWAPTDVSLIQIHGPWEGFLIWKNGCWVRGLRVYKQISLKQPFWGLRTYLC